MQRSSGGVPNQGVPRHTRVPQGEARGVNGYLISMDILPILTPKGSAKFSKS